MQSFFDIFQDDDGRNIEQLNSIVIVFHLNNNIN